MSAKKTKTRKNFRVPFISPDQKLFHLFHNGFESILVVHGKVGQHLPVDFDVVFLQQVDQLGIGKTFQPCCCIDTLNPERTEISLFLFSVTVGILLPFLPGILRYCPYIFTRTEITFCQFQ